MAILQFVKKNIVFVIAMTAAIVTSFFVPPDKEYFGYFDWKTLVCLFLTLAVICALRNIKFFTILSRRLVLITGNLRGLFLMLIVITFVGSMLIANDMALLTFLPLGYFVLSGSGKEKYMAFTFIMQNIAANLGGMLTPFGNPQNLYLYTKFNIPTGEFCTVMLPPFLLSVFIITVCCFIFVKPEPLDISDEKTKLDPVRVTLYLALFALSIAIVFRSVPYQLGLVIIPSVLFFADRDALRAVDYPLLLTFVFFFIFAGNMSRIDIVNRVFSWLLSKSTLLFSVLSCQVISNVPSAILLSQFTGDWTSLLIGVNIGGVGTLISSLASLITFREYIRHNPGKIKEYIVRFSIFNFAFLFLLTGFMFILR